jgi:hypothetical protein
MTEPAAIRASDADRDAVAAQLRAHCLAGRMRVEDLERRLDLTLRAETIPDLRRLLEDLPPGAASAPAEVGAPMPVGLPGVRPFIRQLIAPADPARIRRAALDMLAPALARTGFELLQQSPDRLVFERITRKGWFSKQRERIVISIEPHDTGHTRMV